ncbi:hypothetical protein LZ554_009111 [Drepanopeziza brunnea f. sp. 'monogermtubi']|nr:hypothetical protein LZ554_009111 [Drepanopeziza brunnea f. sp. 'monogermtubi']
MVSLFIPHISSPRTTRDAPSCNRATCNGALEAFDGQWHLIERDHRLDATLRAYKNDRNELNILHIQLAIRLRWC